MPRVPRETTQGTGQSQPQAYREEPKTEAEGLDEPILWRVKKVLKVLKTFKGGGAIFFKTGYP